MDSALTQTEVAEETPRKPDPSTAPSSGVLSTFAPNISLGDLARVMGLALALVGGTLTAPSIRFDPWADVRRYDLVSYHSRARRRRLSLREAQLLAIQVLEEAELARLRLADAEAARGITWVG